MGDRVCIGFDPDDEEYRYKHLFDWNTPTEGVRAIEEFTRPDLQYVLSADDIPQLEALGLNRNFRIGQPVHMLTIGDQGVRILVTDTVGAYGSARGIIVDEGEGLDDGLKVVRNGDGVVNPAAINHGRVELLGPRDMQILEAIPAELRSRIAHITLSFAEDPDSVQTALSQLRGLGYTGGCYAKVETPKGVENISGIAELKDLAGIVFGLGDLGAAMSDNKYPATIQALSTLRAGEYHGSVAIADDYPYPDPSDVPNLRFQEMVATYGQSLSRWITGKGMRAKDPQVLQGVLTNGFTPF